ncbi:MAG: TolC family protein [Reichenbachiella sp.]
MSKRIVIILTWVVCSCYTIQAQTLESYFEEAAKNNPGLQAKYKGFEAAIEKVHQANALPDPTLSFGYFIWPVETRVGPQRAKFSLTQMFPWFGTLKAQGDAVALLAEAKYQEFLDARNLLFYQVSTAYYPLYELEQMIRLEEDNARILESYKAIATKQFENGKAAMVDVLRADITLKDANTNIQILKEKKSPLQVSFNALLNRDLNSEVKLSDSLNMEALAINYRRDSLLSANPKLAELELKLEASKAMEQAAKKQGLPKFGVGLDYVIVGERSDMVVADNGQDILMPMISMTIPIFRKKYNASVNEARLMQESYQLQQQDYTNGLQASYESVAYELSTQRQLVDLYDQQISEANQALNLLFTAYGNSGKEFEEVLRMQQQLLKYEKMKFSAMTRYFNALAKINYITAKKY